MERKEGSDETRLKRGSRVGGRPLKKLHFTKELKSLPLKIKTAARKSVAEQRRRA